MSHPTGQSKAHEQRANAPDVEPLAEVPGANGHAARDGRREKPVVREPDDISQHLCDRVRELRRQKGWTLEQLSTACGVSRSMLSQIERNQANPTLAVAFRIAQAFGMSLGRLVDAPGSASRIDVVRKADQAYDDGGELVKIRTLSPLHLEKDVEFYELTLRPGGALISEAHFQGVREVLTVGRGSVEITCGDDHVTLNPGDSAHYAADVPHSITNTGKQDAVVVLAELYR
jgi:transcriptional regulator with XRE-family HTH domain